MAQMQNVLIPHLVDVQSVKRNVLAIELRKRGVRFRKSHIAASAWLMDVQETTMLQWRALLQYTRLDESDLNDALLKAKLMR